MYDRIHCNRCMSQRHNSWKNRMENKEDRIILVDIGFRYNIRAEITCPELVLLPVFPLHTLTAEKC